MAKNRTRERLRKMLEESTATRHRTARNFLKSMFLLGVALISALYSNGAASEGRIASAGLGALIAMSIAVWVAVRIVPSLAAGVDWKWLPFFTQYRLTREGWLYIAATVIVLSAALNTSNNLLYMILSALLAVMVLSGVLSGINFRSLEVSAQLPEHCLAQEPFQVALTLKNRKRLFPTFSISVGPLEGCPFRFGSFYLPLIRVQDRETHMVQTIVPSRGRHTLDALQLKSRYPFGFIMKGRKLEVEASCVAFPEIVPVEDVDAWAYDLLGSSERFVRGQGMDLYMIRDYLSSDSARHVDWKASAKTSKMKIREFAAEEDQTVRLRFDRFGLPGDEARFERLVSQAASFAYHLSEAGVAVTLVSEGTRPTPERSDGALESILYYLALVEMTSAAQPPVCGEEGTVTFSLRSGSERHLRSFGDWTSIR
jgi:uncharacterized protein (DUF58 family)